MRYCNWYGADSNQMRRYDAVARLFCGRQHLVTGIFDRHEAKLRASPAELLKHYRILSPGEFVLVKVALDIWCRTGGARVSELLDLEIHNFSSVLSALSSLRENELECTRNF